MAYVKKEDEVTTDPNAAPEQKTVGGGSVITGGGDGTATAPSKSSNSLFTNLGGYLSANANKGANLADKLGGVITGQKQKAEGSIGNVGTAFEDQLNKSTYNPSEDLKSKLSSGSYQDIAGNEALANEFKQGYQGTTAAPKTAEEMDSYTKAQADIAEANRLGKGALTPEGQAELLKTSAQGRATGGGLALNQLFLQAKPAQEKLNNYSKSVQDLDTKLAALKTMSAQKAADVAAQNAATTQEYQTKYTPEALKSDLEQQAAIKRGILEGRNAAITNQMRSEGVGKENFINNVDVNKANIQSVANLDQYSKMKALAQLTGRTNYLPNESLANTWDVNPNLNFDQWQAQYQPAAVYTPPTTAPLAQQDTNLGYRPPQPPAQTEAQRSGMTRLLRR